MNDVIALGSQQLQAAIDKIKSLGLASASAKPQAIVQIIDEIKDLDEGSALFVARTLSEQVSFDTLVVEKISGTAIGSEYNEITTAFDSIREDAKAAVQNAASGKEKSIFSKLTSFFKEATEGDIADRFTKIETRFNEITSKLDTQLKGEKAILDAYQLFRGALGRSQVAALELKAKAEAELNTAKEKALAAQAAVDAAQTADEATKVNLGLERDAANDEVHTKDKRFQITKDLAENLQIAYSVSEVTMKKLADTSELKDRIWHRSVSFFATNRSTLAALKANYASVTGLAEGTNTLDAMTGGINKSLSDLADVSGTVTKKAIQSGYGATIDPAVVQKLVDAIIKETEESVPLIAEMRTLATKNATEISTSVEDGKRRYAELANKINA